MKEHKCEICEMVFKTKMTFRKHFSTINDAKRGLITCNICTKTFPIQSDSLKTNFAQKVKSIPFMNMF